MALQVCEIKDHVAPGSFHYQLKLSSFFNFPHDTVSWVFTISELCNKCGEQSPKTSSGVGWEWLDPCIFNFIRNSMARTFLTQTIALYFSTQNS